MILLENVDQSNACKIHYRYNGQSFERLTDFEDSYHLIIIFDSWLICVCEKFFIELFSKGL